MSVKRYDLVGDMDGNCNLNEARMEHSDDGSYVSYEDYAALEARCAALAAEMAWLKKFCKDAAFDADYEAELGMDRGGFTDALNNIKTPATDAFLAEVRAQGVDDFCKMLGTYAKVEPERFNPQFADLYAKIVNRIFSEVMDNPEVYDLGTMSDWLERESEESRAYADMSINHHAQLRKGGATEERQSFLSDEDCQAFVKAFTKGAAQ
nr:hypothetical protein [Enterobacter roggenkampii]